VEKHNIKWTHISNALPPTSVSDPEFSIPVVFEDYDGSTFIGRVCYSRQNDEHNGPVWIVQWGCTEVQRETVKWACFSSLIGSIED